MRQMLIFMFFRLWRDVAGARYILQHVEMAPGYLRMAGFKLLANSP